ncbi:MAG: vWA domain-containing protein, partial [Phycisphaerae bacterium]
SPRARVALAVLRCTTLLLLGIIGLEPVLARYLLRRRDAVTVLLVDDSASMTVRDRYRDPALRERMESVLGEIPADGASRLEVVKHVMRDDEFGWLRALAARNPVRVFRFSDRAEPIGFVATDTEPAGAAAATDAIGALVGAGAATDLGRAIRDALGATSGMPRAAVILLSDGGINAGESTDAIVRRLRAARTPLFAVGVGDPATPPNRRVVNLTGPRSAFADDPFQVAVQIEADGLDEEPVEVVLLERRSGAPLSAARVIDRRTIHADGDGRFAPVEFECRVETPGAHILTARVPPASDEVTETDNVRDMTSPIQILERKLRILLIAGAPSYEYRYLSRLLERDETIDLSCWLQSADARAVRDGNTVIDHLPATRDELFDFDALVLLDPDPEGFDPQWAGLASQMVDAFGGGLLYAADRKWSPAFFRHPNVRPIVDLLPVVADQEVDLRLNELGRYQRRAWPLLLGPDGAASPLLRQSDDPRISAQIWSLLEGVYWHLPVRREKPAATVLMRHGNPRMIGTTGPHVLYAVQFAGAGRTAFLGLNSTWRWNRHGEAYFARFWIQAIRYLTEGKLSVDQPRGTLTTQRDRYLLGDTIVVTLRAFNEAFEPLILDTLDLRIESDRTESRQVRLTPVPGREGFYRGRFVADHHGALRMSVLLPSNEASPVTVVRDVFVGQPDIEFRRPALRRDVLSQLAEAANGRYLDPADADQLPELIKDRSETLEVRDRPISLWDNPYVLAALIGLLTLEWIGRKRARMM